MQIAYTFDRETVKNILHGVWHSLMTTSMLLILNALFQISGLVHITDPALAGLYMLACQNIYNTVKEYISGE